MKVDPNQPAMPFVKHTTHSVEYYKGMPIKLELAARFHAARLSNPGLTYNSIPVKKRIELSLAEAELFIIQFNNEQQEDEK